MKQLTLGSLFDGAGGFPLAGALAGITPVWASEIEPFPLRVTTKRLPDMKHLGDITKINGADIEPVDIITFGSPCQDLSIAGKRAALAAVWQNTSTGIKTFVFPNRVRCLLPEITQVILNSTEKV